MIRAGADLDREVEILDAYSAVETVRDIFFTTFNHCTNYKYAVDKVYVKATVDLERMEVEEFLDKLLQNQVCIQKQNEPELIKIETNQSWTNMTSSDTEIRRTAQASTVPCFSNLDDDTSDGVKTQTRQDLDEEETVVRRSSRRSTARNIVQMNEYLAPKKRGNKATSPAIAVVNKKAEADACIQIRKSSTKKRLRNDVQQDQANVENKPKKLKSEEFVAEDENVLIDESSKVSIDYETDVSDIVLNETEIKDLEDLKEDNNEFELQLDEKLDDMLDGEEGTEIDRPIEQPALDIDSSRNIITDAFTELDSDLDKNMSSIEQTPVKKMRGRRKKNKIQIKTEHKVGYADEGSQLDEGIEDQANAPNGKKRRKRGVGASQYITFKEYVCFECVDNPRCNDIDAYISHWEKNHVVTESNRQFVQCKECSTKVKIVCQTGSNSINRTAFMNAISMHLNHLIKKHDKPIPVWIEYYKCQYEGCEYFALNNIWLMQHVGQVHEVNDQVVCERCNRPLKQKSLPKHMMICLGKSGDNGKYLKSRSINMTSWRCFLCQDDSQIFSTKQAFIQHIKTKHVTQRENGKACIPCRLCEMVHLLSGKTNINATYFQTIGSSLQHLVMKHGVPLPSYVDVHRCTYEGCDFIGVKRYYLDQHMADHYGPVPCERCGSLVKAHNMREHSKRCPNRPKGMPKLKRKPLPKKYGCSLCPYKTKDHYTFNHHMVFKHRINTSGKPMYKCDKCNYVDIHKNLFDNHVKNVHGTETWSCHICGNTFKNKTYLEYHMNTHNQEIYNCPLCTFTCNIKWNMTRHLKAKHPDQYGEYKNQISQLPNQSIIHVLNQNFKLDMADDIQQGNVKTEPVMGREGKGENAAQKQVTLDQPVHGADALDFALTDNPEAMAVEYYQVDHTADNVELRPGMVILQLPEGDGRVGIPVELLQQP